MQPVCDGNWVLRDMIPTHRCGRCPTLSVKRYPLPKNEAGQSPNLERAIRAIDRLSDFASPAALRNALPIVEALDQHLPAQGHIIEIAAGTGFHSAVLAAQFPNLTWQPSEADPRAVNYSKDLAGHAGLVNLRPSILLDVETEDWPI